MAKRKRKSKVAPEVDKAFDVIDDVFGIFLGTSFRKGKFGQ